MSVESVVDSILSDKTAPPSAPDQILKGIGLVICAFFIFALMSCIAKYLTDTYHTAEIVFWRNALCLPFVAFYLYRSGGKKVFTPLNKWGVFWRGFIGSTGAIITYEAFKRLPLADTTVLLFTTVLIVPIIAHFLLGERIGKHRILAIVFGFIGVLFIARPSGDVYMAGVLWALLAACFHAGAQVTLRLLKNENSMMVMFYFVLSGVLIPLVLLPFVWIGVQDFYDFMLFVLIAISGCVAQILFTYAFKYAPASVVAPFNYTGLIWATGFDILIWHYVPGWPVFVGGGIIISSKLYIIWREHKNEQTAPLVPAK